MPGKAPPGTSFTLFTQPVNTKFSRYLRTFQTAASGNFLARRSKRRRGALADGGAQAELTALFAGGGGLRGWSEPDEPATQALAALELKGVDGDEGKPERL